MERTLQQKLAEITDYYLTTYGPGLKTQAIFRQKANLRISIPEMNFLLEYADKHKLCLVALYNSFPGQYYPGFFADEWGDLKNYIYKIRVTNTTGPYVVGCDDQEWPLPTTQITSFHIEYVNIKPPSDNFTLQIQKIYPVMTRHTGPGFTYTNALNGNLITDNTINTKTTFFNPQETTKITKIPGTIQLPTDLNLDPYCQKCACYNDFLITGQCCQFGENK